jgi:hypothetical protein
VKEKQKGIRLDEDMPRGDKVDSTAHLEVALHGQRVEVAGGGMVAWPHVASAVTRQPARSVRRLVPLTCGPSGLFKLIHFLPKLQLHNLQTQSSLCPKMAKFCRSAD